MGSENMIDVFLGKNFETLIKSYKMYLVRYEKIQTAVKDLYTVNKKAMKFLKGKKRIAMYMIQPVQRPPRYLLLLKTILSSTPTDHEQHEDLKKTCEIVDKLVIFVNESQREAENRYGIDKIQDKLTHYTK